MQAAEKDTKVLINDDSFLVEVNKKAHADLKAQKPAVLWFTGLSGSGKTTISEAVEGIGKPLCDASRREGLEQKRA